MFCSQMSEHGQIDVMMWTFHIVVTDNVRIEGEARQRILMDICMLQHERNDDEDNGWVR